MVNIRGIHWITCAELLSLGLGWSFSTVINAFKTEYSIARLTRTHKGKEKQFELAVFELAGLLLNFWYPVND